MMTYKVACGVCTGLQHRLEGIPCQDNAVPFRSPAVTGVAIADGAGSRTHSEIGSQLVTQALADTLKNDFDNLYALPDLKAAAGLLKVCLSALSQTQYTPYDLACTVIFYAGNADGRFLAGHLGDGAMVLAEEDNVQIFSLPENGEYSNETYFITSQDAAQHFRLYRGKRETNGTMLLMTDGVENCLINHHGLTPAPACEAIAKWLNELDEQDTERIISENLENVFSGKNDDDLTLSIVSWEIK